MMSYLPFFGLVVLCGIFSKVSAVGTQFGQSTIGNNGFVVISATYTDASCARLDTANNVMYVPVGACIPTGTGSSVLYSTTNNIDVILTQFTASLNCNGATTTPLTDFIVGTTITNTNPQSITTTGGNTGTVQRQICVAQTGNNAGTFVSSYYITANPPVLAGTVLTTT